MTLQGNQGTSCMPSPSAGASNSTFIKRPVDLFNLQLAHGWFTLDLRSKDAYEQGHLPFAWNIPPLETSSDKSIPSKADVIRLATHIEEALPPDSHAFAIIYGSSSSSTPSFSPSSSSYEFLERIASYLGDYEDPTSYKHCQLVYSILPEVYEGFVEAYPFLITKLLPTDPNLHIPFYPSQISPLLFLSGANPARLADPPSLYIPMSKSKNRQVLYDLNIRRIINLSAADNAFPHDAELRYHRSVVKDAAEQDMSQAIASCLAFIGQAHEENLRVLVHCDHGQSRSVTIVIAHLLHKHSPSSSPLPEVEDVLSHLRQAHPKAHPNPGFIKQLQTFRSQLLGGR